jgi:hydroxymethylglutaryl-CoA reductase
MALEEPSVIAAVSNAAKLISENKGFFCFSDPNIMISQIHIVDTNVKKSKDALILNKEKIVKYANQCCQKMVQRGGGVKNLFVRILEEGLILKFN